MRLTLLCPLALAALSLCADAADAPACYPAEQGCTVGYVEHIPAESEMCVVWFDLTGLVPKMHGYCLHYEDIAPDETGSIADLWFGRLTKAEKDALFLSQVTRELTPAEQAAMQTLQTHEPESVFVVAPHRDDVDRATYYVIDGRRYVSRKRIAVGAPCYPSVYTQGTSMAIRTTQPLEVAVCARR